jgi:Domain of unknown function (DUF4386)
MSTKELRRTARTTGLLYLGIALTGLFGHLLIRSQLYDAHDPATTLAQLVDHESLARLGVALELGIVVMQALAGLWFYRLFRRVDSFAAGSLAAFSFVNAIVILVSAVFLGTALDVALDPALAPAGDAAATAQLMYIVSDHLWLAGEVFFGLWLVPMGRLVLLSGWMPRPLGWILVVGGAAYVIGPFLAYLTGARLAADLVVVPATVGEFWMIGYLLLRGISAGTSASAKAMSTSPLPAGGNSARQR